MKKIIALLCLSILFLVTQSFAQQQQYCGTMGKSPWLTHYQQHKHEYTSVRNNEVMYVPMSIFILGSNSGQGYFPRTSLYRAICQLNIDFAEANIFFYVKGEIQYVNNSAWYNHPEFSGGAEMMNALNIENTVNCYIVENPAGNCGYSSGWLGGIALSKGCLGPGDHTWAHEIGHDLSLPHPFIGWEGTDYNPQMPTPSEIDGQPVELLDGSNCSIAADGFCDTQADYLSYRWSCNSENLSNTVLSDPNGEEFRADGTLFMSYSLDQCSSRFSPQQIEAMRANLQFEKQDYLNQESPLAPIADTDTVQLISPINDVEVPYNFVQLAWNYVPNATHYHVQVSRTSGFELIVKESVTTDTVFNVSNILLANKNYYWRVRPTNRYDYCQTTSVRGTFKTTSEVAGINDVQETTLFTLRPNITSQGNDIQLSLNKMMFGTISLQIISANGVVVASNKFASLQETYINTQKLSKGFYIVQLSINENKYYQKLIIN
ncbi:MAG: zinc-dependent metalloprotease [Saprospiraceae bacterium]|nr:zinc-dependent metalloprotease [Saprospiraceae bacterium]